MQRRGAKTQRTQSEKLCITMCTYVITIELELDMNKGVMI